MPSQQVNKKLMIRLQDNEMKRSQGDERMMTRWKNIENNDRCQGNDSMQSWEDRKCWQDRIQKKKKWNTHPDLLKAQQALALQIAKDVGRPTLKVSQHLRSTTPPTI